MLLRETQFSADEVRHGDEVDRRVGAFVACSCGMEEALDPRNPDSKWIGEMTPEIVPYCKICKIPCEIDDPEAGNSRYHCPQCGRYEGFILKRAEDTLFCRLCKIPCEIDGIGSPINIKKTYLCHKCGRSRSHVAFLSDIQIQNIISPKVTIGTLQKEIRRLKRKIIELHLEILNKGVSETRLQEIQTSLLFAWQEEGKDDYTKLTFASRLARTYTRDMLSVYPPAARVCICKVCQEICNMADAVPNPLWNQLEDSSGLFDDEIERFLD